MFDAIHNCCPENSVAVLLSRGLCDNSQMLPGIRELRFGKWPMFDGNS